MKCVSKTLMGRGRSGFPILRAGVIAAIVSLLLVGSLNAIDSDLTPVGGYALGGSVWDVVIVGNRAYTVSSWRPASLRVFDVRDPAQPMLLGEYRTRGSAYGVAVVGEYAYVVGSGRLEVFNVKNPAIPQWLGTCDIPDALSVAVSDRFAYVVGRAGLQVVDVSDPTAPKPVAGHSTRGPASGVAVSGDYAYLAESKLSQQGAELGARLWVIDIRNPAHPQAVGAFETGNPISGFAVSGNYAYLAEAEAFDFEGNKVGARFRVIDISEPTNPRVAGGYDSSHSLYRVVVSGIYAYLLTEPDALTLFDISDPANPRLAGECSVGGSAQSLAVSGAKAYIGTSAGFEIVDVSNPASPQGLGTYGNGPFLHRLVVSGAYGYVIEGACHPLAGCSGDELKAVDFTNPLNPKPVGSYHSWGWIYGHAVSDNYAYLAEGSNLLDGEDLEATNEFAGSLSVIDIRNPAKPTLVGTYKTGGALTAVAVSGGYACVLEGARWSGTNQVTGGLRVLDISNPANPRQLGVCEQYCGDALSALSVGPTAATARPQGISLPGPVLLTISGGYAYVAQSRILCIIDITDPGSPRWTGRYQSKSNGDISDVAISGNYAFIASPDTVEVVDIRNPADPRPISTTAVHDVFSPGVAVAGDDLFCSTLYGLQVTDLSSLGITPALNGTVAPGAAGRVAVSAFGAFSSGLTTGVEIFALTPANPQRVGQLASSDIYYGALAVSGNFAYAVAFAALGEQVDRSLHVVDISDPAKPQRVGSYHNPEAGVVMDVAVSGNYAYLAEDRSVQRSRGGGLRVIEVRDPANPREVGLAEPGSSFQGVAVSGPYAYVASPAAGLIVIDISDPAKARSVASYRTGGRAYKVVISGPYAYVTYVGGLDVIDITKPLNPQRHGRYMASSSGAVYGLAVAGKYAYIAVEGLGLLVLDISDPANPRRVAREENGDIVFKVAGAGNNVYVSRHSGQFDVLDVSNLMQLRRVGGNARIHNYIDAMVISNGYLIATERGPSAGGLVILDLFRPVRLDPVGRTTPPEKFRLRVDGPRGVSGWVQRSTHWNNWEDWQAVAFGAAPIEIFDADLATAGLCFYRTVIR